MKSFHFLAISLLLLARTLASAKCPHLIALATHQRSLLQVSGNCNGARTHPYVGYEGDLTTMEHDVSGHISILDDCTFRVTGFNYDGLAPAAYWWGGNGLQQDQLRKGTELSPDRLVDPVTNGDMTIQLPATLTWNNISVISVWCEEFEADFGHVVLSPGKPSAPASGQALAPPPAPGQAATDDFDHCIDLSPNFFQMRWKLDSSDPAQAKNVTVQYRGLLDSNMWMGFGYSMENATQTMMIGSHAIIAGMVGQDCFAYSYFLTQQEQCNYEGAQDAGVCPVSGLLGEPRTNTGNSASLVSCAQGPGNLVTVTYTRPLKATNRFEHEWPVGDAKYGVWAVGPLSQGSTAAQPVVLFHAASSKGPSYAAADFRLSLGAPSACKQLLTAGNAPAPAPSSTKQPPALLDMSKPGNSTIEITTGTNKNYPNPPAWGLSLHANGFETPVIKVARGTNYTFVVMAGETHPIYITDNINGGGEETDILYGGDDTNTGTPANPFTFYWTPNASTPDTVFYQCFNHRKLGWIVKVVNADGSTANVPNPNSDTVQMLSALPQSLTDPSLAVGSTAAASAPAPATASGDKGCRVTRADGRGELYANCVSLTEDASEVRLNWRLDTLAGRRDMTGLLQCKAGWCAWGLPQTPGEMVGASVIVVKSCSTCQSGAEVEEYFLAAQSVAGVQPTQQGTLEMLQADAFKLPDGTLQAFFTVRLPQTAADSNYKINCIGASGALSSNGGLSQHSSSASLTAVLDLAAGGASVSASPSSKYRVAHGTLMVVAWCFLLPISVMVARTCKSNRPPAWFLIHRAMGVIAVAMITAGLGLGIKAWIQGVAEDSIFIAHVSIGFITFGLVVVQGLAAAWRPGKASVIRKLWTNLHIWKGRTALLLAFANAIIGFNLSGVLLPAWWSWGLAIIWVCIFLAGAAKEALSRRSAAKQHFANPLSGMGMPNHSTDSVEALNSSLHLQSTQP